jgi:hypothetical protein
VSLRWAPAAGAATPASAAATPPPLRSAHPPQLGRMMMMMMMMMIAVGHRRPKCWGGSARCWCRAGAGVRRDAAAHEAAVSWPWGPRRSRGHRRGAAATPVTVYPPCSRTIRRRCRRVACLTPSRVARSASRLRCRLSLLQPSPQPSPHPSALWRTMMRPQSARQGKHAQPPPPPEMGPLIPLAAGAMMPHCRCCRCGAAPNEQPSHAPVAAQAQAPAPARPRRRRRP